jgi:hypothetical protein
MKTIGILFVAMLLLVGCGGGSSSPTSSDDTCVLGINNITVFGGNSCSVGDTVTMFVTMYSNCGGIVDNVSFGVEPVASGFIIDDYFVEEAGDGHTYYFYLRFVTKQTGNVRLWAATNTMRVGVDFIIF